MYDNIIIGGIFLTLFIVIISKCCYTEYKLNKERKRQININTQILENNFSNLESPSLHYNESINEDPLPPWKFKMEQINFFKQLKLFKILINIIIKLILL
jgi:hypothetical protein